MTEKHYCRRPILSFEGRSLCLTCVRALYAQLRAANDPRAAQLSSQLTLAEDFPESEEERDERIFATPHPDPEITAARQHLLARRDRDREARPRSH